MLDNLVMNAFKYSDAGSPVDLEVRCADGEVQIAVTNRGAGIPPEELPRVFDRYYRTHGARAGKCTGLGLGLHIVKGLVEAHGGRVRVESRPGETTFTVALPALESRA